MRSATCAQTEKREEFGWLAGRNRGPSAIIEIRTARETPPLLALRGQKKARSMSGLWCSGGDEGDRTLDLRIANATLSQLSYVPIALILNVFLRIGSAPVAPYHHGDSRQYHRQ